MSYLKIIKFGAWFLHGVVTSNQFETVSTCIPIMTSAFGLPNDKVGIITSTSLRNIELSSVFTQIILLLLGIRHRIIGYLMLLSHLIISLSLVFHALLCNGESGVTILYIIMFAAGIIEALSMLSSVSWRSDVTTALMTGFNFSGLPQRLYQHVTLKDVDPTDKDAMRHLLVMLWIFNLAIVVVYILFMFMDLHYVIPFSGSDYKPFSDIKLLKDTFLNIKYVKYPIIFLILMESGYYLFYPSIAIFSIDSYTKENYEYRTTILNLFQSLVIIVVSMLFLLWDILDPKCFQLDGFPAYKSHMQFLNFKENNMWILSMIVLFIMRLFFGVSYVMSYIYPDNVFLNYLKDYRNLFPIVMFMGFTRAFGSNISAGSCYGLMFQRLIIRNLTSPDNEYMNTLGNLKLSIENNADEKYSEILNNANLAIDNAVLKYSLLSKNKSEGNKTELTIVTSKLNDTLAPVVNLKVDLDSELENKSNIIEVIDCAKKLHTTINQMIKISYKSTQLMIFFMVYLLLYFTEVQSKFLKVHHEIKSHRAEKGFHHSDKYSKFRTFWWWVYLVLLISILRLVWPFYTL